MTRRDPNMLKHVLLVPLLQRHQRFEGHHHGAQGNSLVQKRMLFIIKGITFLLLKRLQKEYSLLQKEFLCVLAQIVQSAKAVSYWELAPAKRQEQGRR